MTMDSTRLFRTDVLRGAKIETDRARDVVSGFAVVTKGVTHDRRGEFDDAGLDAVVAMGNSHKFGIKSRFGHPNMSSTALGTFLGRVRDFRRDGDVVRADLHLDPTAHQAPDGDLAKYVLDLTESDPEAFGASMVIHWDEEPREGKDLEGNPFPPYIRVKKLFSVDVVDDPAANEGFFGMPFLTEGVKLSAEGTAFMDRFLARPDAVEAVIGFLQRYRANCDSGEQLKETKTMLQDLTMEKLKAERGDLYSSIFNAGVEEGKKTGERGERDRVVGILKKSGTFQKMGDLALEAIETGLSLEQATIKFQDRQLENLKKANPPSPGPDSEDNDPGPKLSHLERAKVHQKEHGGSMTEALRATAARRE